MIRKSEYYEKIDRYLNQEMTGEELREFNLELMVNSGLSEEVKLHWEVQQAIQEEEIMNLRKKLSSVMMNENHTMEFKKETVVASHSDYNFGLSNEMSSFREFYRPVENNEINSLSHSLPRLHLFQHEVAAKENIHQFYKEQNQEVDSEEKLLSMDDEAIFAEVQQALQEKDVFELRSNLAQIAQSMPEHECSVEEIDEYINHEMEADNLASFEMELQMNQWLEKDIRLHKDIEQAVLESDIMNLRATLGQIQEIENSTSRMVEDINKYMFDELDQFELASFENELVGNPDLAAELEMYKEIDIAVQETDIMELRSNLESIGKSIVKEKQRSVTRIPISKLAMVTVAASLILMLGIAGLVSRQHVSDKALYDKYYETYQTAGVSRSGNTTMDITLTVALQKFNAQEYESALALFQQVIAYDDKNPIGHFYSGVSYQETGRFSNAIKEYEIVVKDKDNLFVEQAEWYIGLCYFQTQDRKKAYKQLERIADSKSYYNKKAEAIIRKLKDIE